MASPSHIAAAEHVQDRFPRSIAIAGAWGYIGRKFLQAARQLGRKTLVYDPGPLPADVDLDGVTRVEQEADFYRQRADLFHLALHPEHRRFGMETLLRRSFQEPILILCEKPMATPDRPQDCLEAVRAVEASAAIVLYDFPELFDPITRRIIEFLGGFRHTAIDSISVQRSKDREDPANARNLKRMLPIQYQETVHCLAWVLFVLAHVQGSLDAVLSRGLSAEAESQPYEPPNPEVYPYVVDGRCRYRLRLGEVPVEGLTDFKRGAPWTKRRVVRGRGDGRPFQIDAEYLEGGKRLVINGLAHTDVAESSSYAEVITAYGAWAQRVPRETLLSQLYPNPRFARVTYQLSSVLWRSSWQRAPVSLGSLDELLGFEATFAREVPRFPRYGSQ